MKRLVLVGNIKKVDSALKEFQELTKSMPFKITMFDLIFMLRGNALSDVIRL